MKVLENTTIEGESPVIEYIYPALDDVPKYRGVGRAFLGCPVFNQRETFA
jgi:hypothetical protein